MTPIEIQKVLYGVGFHFGDTRYNMVMERNDQPANSAETRTVVARDTHGKQFVIAWGTKVIPLR